MNASATDLRGDNRSRLEFMTVIRQDCNARFPLPRCGEGHESHDSGVGLAADDGEFPEILVECHKDARLLMSAPQDLLITWIRRPIAGPDNIVTGLRESNSSPAPNTTIEQDPQAALPPRAGSTRSWPTSRRA